MRRRDRKDRNDRNDRNDRKAKNANRRWSICHPEVLRRICVVRRWVPDPSEYLRMTTIFNPSPALSCFAIAAFFASVTTPPNAPQHPQMPPQNSIWQNEPTAAHLGAFGCLDFVRGLRQLAPVSASERQCTSTSIWQNEPTVAHSGTLRRRISAEPRSHGVQRHATGCNRPQRRATKTRDWQNEPTGPSAPRRGRSLREEPLRLRAYQRDDRDRRPGEDRERDRAAATSAAATATSAAFDGVDLAEQPARFVIDAGGEVERVGARAGRAVAKRERPELIVRQRFALVVAQG